MATFDTSMYWPKIETLSLKSNAELTGSTFIITGIIVTLWSNCISVTGISNGYLDAGDGFILVVGFITHVIISLSTTGALVNGIKRNDPDLLKPWMYIKAIEVVGIFFGIIVQCFSYNHRRYSGIIPVGIIFMLIGSYLFLCVFTAYKKMKDNHQRPTATNNLDSGDLDNPPSYDSFDSQTNVL